MKTITAAGELFLLGILLAGCACGRGDDKNANVVHMTSSLKFSPATITIGAGETVRWSNSSIMIHTVTADPKLAKRPDSVVLPDSAQPFNSGNILPGGKFDYTFTVPGIYRYFCLPHESFGMTGTVVVEAPEVNTAHIGMGLIGFS